MKSYTWLPWLVAAILGLAGLGVYLTQTVSGNVVGAKYFGLRFPRAAGPLTSTAAAKICSQYRSAEAYADAMVTAETTQGAIPVTREYYIRLYKQACQLGAA